MSEKRNEQLRGYRSDALGSTVSLYDNNQAVTDSFTYWPYGETRTSSGSTGTKYKFVGTLGCREQTDSGVYMLASVSSSAVFRVLAILAPTNWFSNGGLRMLEIG